MVTRAKEGILKRIEEEFIHTTDTLWENEVSANIYVAKVLLGTTLIDIVFLLLAIGDTFTIDKKTLTDTLFWALFELAIPALICLHYKGKKKWLKILMMIAYTIVLARVESVLTHNATLCMVFPTVLSIRYYSQPLTNLIAALTTILTGIADYYAVAYQMGRLDLNMVELPAGTVLTFLNDATLRDIVMSQGTIDYQKLWSHTVQHSFLPKIILFSLVAVISSEIAKRGRKAIFSQQKETQKSERISTELNVASGIQTNMLPNIFPPFPERDDFDIYATMSPAKEVGGDFYDFFMVDEDHIAIVIADVSGKGIPAAMFMVIAKTLIKDHTQLGLQPDDVFTRVNRILCDGNEAGMFVTAWMGVLDLRDGKMVYVNAGHNPPVVKLDGKLQFLHSKPGFIMAGLEDYRYTMSELQLKKGDMIFLYTDGVTEATNLDQELYGEKRLLECLDRQAGKNCAGILRAVREDVDDFVGEAEQFDDLTMLVFDYSQKDSKHMTAERTFDASDDKLHDVLSFVEEELEKHDVSMKTMMAINVAVEEIFVNIAHYAYEGRPGKAVVGMNFDEDNVHIYLVDNGIPFNPLEMKDPDITAGVDEREIGGLGIYMVKKSMDKCTYERRNNQNVFVMRKAIR